MTGPSQADRLAGGVWGHLVGDAMGVPYEFRQPSQVGVVRWGETGSHHQPPGTWSDDGALMLALLDSLLERGFDVEDQGQRALRWMREGAYSPDGRFDIGTTTRTALTRISAGSPAATAGGSGESDNGNGSLMRILPIALVSPGEEDDILVAQASAASAVTHAHPRSRVTCAIYTLLARNLIVGITDRAEAIGAAFESFEAVMPEDWEADFEVLQDHASRKVAATWSIASGPRAMHSRVRARTPKPSKGRSGTGMTPTPPPALPAGWPGFTGGWRLSRRNGGRECAAGKSSSRSFRSWSAPRTEAEPG